MGKASGTASSEGFDDFWTAYPRKKNKPDALKAWQQTADVRPPTPELLLAVGEAVAEWRRQGRKPQYVPYPATWLRGMGWLDVPDGEPEPERALSYDELRARREQRMWRAGS